MERLLPLVTAISVDDCVRAVGEIARGGIRSAEIALRADCALDAIRECAAAFPDMRIGAGTVLDAGQCARALDCGSRFVVSPGLSEDVAAACAERNIPYYPGCVTPTEIMRALKLGLNVLKFFPADVYGGLKAMKALSGPFPAVRWIPTGGVSLDTLPDYLAWDKIAAVGGSFFTKGDIAGTCYKAVGLAGKERAGST